MRRITLLLILFLFTFCSKDSDNILMTEYIDRYNQMIELDTKAINEISRGLEDYISSFKSSERKIKPWFDKMKRISDYSTESFSKIETFKKEIFTSIEINSIDIKRTKLKSEKVKKIKEVIETINNNFVSILKADSSAFVLIDMINLHLNTENWKGINGLNGLKCKNLELYTLLTKFQYYIKSIERDIITFLRTKLSLGGSYQYIYMKSIIKPEASEVKLGEKYKAEMYVGLFDSSRNPVIMINNKQIKVKQAKGQYRKLITRKDTGKVNKHMKRYSVSLVISYQAYAN